MPYQEIYVLVLGISRNRDSISSTDKQIFEDHLKNWYSEKKIQFEKTGFGDVVEINKDSVTIDGKYFFVDNYQIYHCLNL